MKWADFPLEEYQGRYLRLKQAMRRHGMDALLVTQPENCRYFAGTLTQGWICKSYQFPALLPADDRLEPVKFNAPGDEHIAVTSWIDKLKHYQRVDGWNTGLCVADAIGQVVGDMNLSSARIGLELGEQFRINLGPQALQALYQKLPQVEFVDAHDVIWQVRAIKSEAEIDRLKRANLITLRALRKTFEQLSVGMTERQVAHLMLQNMAEHDMIGANLMYFFVHPQRAMFADSVPSDAKLQNPGIIQFDGGAVYDGYYADTKRYARAGPLNDTQKRTFDAALDAQQACLDKLRVGNTCGDVFDTAMAAWEKHGFSQYVQWIRQNNFTCVGHSIGQDIHESPLLSMGNRQLLEEDMVLNIEPLITGGGVTPWWQAESRFGVEDTVRITGGAPEILTPAEILPWQMWQVC